MFKCKCKRDFTCRALKWAFLRVTWHMTHKRWLEHVSLVLVWTVTFPLKKTKQPLILNLYRPICVKFEWNSEKLYMVFGFIITRYLSRKYQKLSQSYYTVFRQGFAPHCGTRGFSVRIGIKGSWRLCFGKWVLYFIECYISYIRSLGVLWPLTLSAKICGHVTWVVCY